MNRPAVCSWSSAGGLAVQLDELRDGDGIAVPGQPAQSGRQQPAVALGDGVGVAEHRRGLAERPFVRPEPQQFATEDQDRDDVERRAGVLFPASLEHEGGVDDHQRDRERQGQAQHRQGAGIDQPADTGQTGAVACAS